MSNQGCDLRVAMNLVGLCHLAWLNPEQGSMPTGGYEVAHDTGRWWDAMLRLEATTGFVIPADLEAAMLRNIQALMGNHLGVLMERAVFNPHNFREGLLALAALVRYRDSAWAREAGHRLLTTLDRFLLPDGRLDQDPIVAELRAPLPDDACHRKPPGRQWYDETVSTGRALEAVLFFHEATGDPLALSVADRIASYNLVNSVNRDGAIRSELIDPSHSGHNHSYLGTLRGLLRYGIATRRGEFVDAVFETYRTSLWKHNISWSGWTPHDLGTIRFPDSTGDPIGEHGSCADVAQLAMWLAFHKRHPDLLDDVERLVRARLLPSQIAAGDDPRQVGAWGVYGHPFGYGCTLDVFAAVLHTLTDIHQHIVTVRHDGSVDVNLHFDTQTPWADVEVERAEVGSLRVTPKQAGGLRIRVPGWTPYDELTLTASGRPLPLLWDSGYLVVAPNEAPTGTVVELKYALPPSETVEEMPVSHRSFRLSWRGDQVVGCDPKVPIYG